QPAVASVKGMAEQLELSELCVALDRLLLALADARIAGGVVNGQPRANVLDAYFPLMELVPGGLELDAERNRREPVIVHSLLRQIPGVEKVTIDKLVAASLISIATLADARPDELSAVTGVSDEIAERLVERFRAYRAEAGVVASPDPSAEHRSLAALLERRRQGTEAAVPPRAGRDTAPHSRQPGAAGPGRSSDRARPAQLQAQGRLHRFLPAGGAGEPRSTGARPVVGTRSATRTWPNSSVTTSCERCSAAKPSRAPTCARSISHTRTSRERICAGRTSRGQTWKGSTWPARSCATPACARPTWWPPTCA